MSGLIRGAGTKTKARCTRKSTLLRTLLLVLSTLSASLERQSFPHIVHLAKRVWKNAHLYSGVALHLVRGTDSGLTSENQLAINGASAGGLLMGAVVNMAYVNVGLNDLEPLFGSAFKKSCRCACLACRPQGLFRCVVAEVPFVDVLQTMSDPSIPLTVSSHAFPHTIALPMRIRSIG